GWVRWSASGLLKDCVADAVRGAHDHVGPGGGQSFSKARHSALQRVGRYVLAKGIQGLFELTATDDLFSTPEQMFQQCDLAWRGFDARFVDGDGARRGVKRHIAQLEDDAEARARPSQQGAAASCELRDLEGLDHIIIGTAVEPDQAIVETAACGENE